MESKKVIPLYIYTVYLFNLSDLDCMHGIERVQFSSVAGARKFSLGKIQIIGVVLVTWSPRVYPTFFADPGPNPAGQAPSLPTRGCGSGGTPSTGYKQTRLDRPVRVSNDDRAWFAYNPVDGVVGRAGGCPAENFLGWGAVSYTRKLNSLYTRGFLSR